jgi:hypothetical protein
LPGFESDVVAACGSSGTAAKSAKSSQPGFAFNLSTPTDPGPVGALRRSAHIVIERQSLSLAAEMVASSSAAIAFA